ncbi:cysteine protease [Sporothrix epigloea]|uniref:Cysteine protease n=1 Tax=Sporothrix epigloea TaxID=1892477 RepID=A0ABP0DLY2_9PEZI
MKALSGHDTASSDLEKFGTTDKLMLARNDSDLVQDITTDCSVVASLCAITQYASDHGGQASMLEAVMSPYDAAKGHPLVSENGKYIFRMQFNGTFRKVTIDDRLPASKSRALFVVDRQNPYLLWPALLEKAYLKLHGGYDFPGSNSGTDLWVLTGWIPEQVFIQSDETDLGLVWTRSKGAFERGHVMITLGTGRLTSEEETLLGLAGQHDYAVLKLEVDSNGVRRMLVKNPWCDGLVWRGHGLGSVSETTRSPTTGTFWIDFEDVVQYYESLYLNWDPSLFNYRQDHHLNWVLPKKATSHSLASNPQYAMVPEEDGTVWILLNRHIQDAELDIIRRKRQSVSTALKDADNAGNAKQGAAPTFQSGTTMPNDVGFITIYVFSVDGKRVQLPDRPRWIKRAPLIDSPQTLVCFEARRAVPYTIVVAQSGLPLPSYSFTLSFFSSASLVIGSALEMLAHQYEVLGEWSRATAGGSVASPDFVLNPQYALIIPKPTPLSLLLDAEADDVPVRVDLVWARGQRVASLAVRDLVVSSGEYQRGCALATVTPRTPLSSAASSPTAPHMSGSVSSGNGSGSAGFGSGVVDAGTYTVVVSTFERAQLTRYTLRVGSAVPIELRTIPAEDSGKLRTSLEPLMLTFDRTSRSGHGECLGDGDECELRAYAVLNARLNTRVSLIVQAVERRAHNVYTATAAAAAAASTIALRVSIERMTPGSSRRIGDVIATTGDGEFLDMTVAGLRTGDSTLGRASPQQGRDLTMPCFRVVMEMRKGRRLPNVGIRVDILSSDRVEAQPWVEF